MSYSSTSRLKKFFLAGLAGGSSSSSSEASHRPGAAGMRQTRRSAARKNALRADFLGPIHKFDKNWSAAWLPVLLLPSDCSSSIPNQTPAVTEGVKPINQASRVLLVVPVLPPRPFLNLDSGENFTLHHPQKQFSHDLAGPGTQYLPEVGLRLFQNAAIPILHPFDDNGFGRLAAIGKVEKARVSSNRVTWRNPGQRNNWDKFRC